MVKQKSLLEAAEDLLGLLTRKQLMIFIKCLLDSLTGLELKEVIRYATMLRKERCCMYLELPPELRLRIYSLVFGPEDVDCHARCGRAPALLKVCRQVLFEAMELYYSHELMKVETYDESTADFEAITDPVVFQAVLARWIGYRIVFEESVECVKSIIVETPKFVVEDHEGFFDDQDSWCQGAVFTNLKATGKKPWYCIVPRPERIRYDMERRRLWKAQECLGGHIPLD